MEKIDKQTEIEMSEEEICKKLDILIACFEEVNEMLESLSDRR